MDFPGGRSENIMEQRATCKRHNTSKGFTVIEALVVVVVLAVLMAVAMPLYLSAMADSQAKDCRSNMQTIANLEQEYKIKSSSHVYTSTISNLSSLVPNVPICPSGGTYSITFGDGTKTANNGQVVPNGGLIVNCSSTSHGVFALNVDTN